MNWDAIGAVGEILGAVAVALSLFYLARQIQVQNKSNARAAQESVIEGFNVTNTILGTDPKAAALFKKGLYFPESLSDEEIFQWGWLYRAYLNQYLKLYRMHQEGTISRVEWEAQSAQGADLILTPGGQVFQQSHCDDFGDVFEALAKMKKEGGSWDVTMGRGNGAA